MYRLFYIVLSLSIISIYLTPFLFLLRFLMRKLPGKYTTALWGLFFLRAVCPVGMSSPFSLIPDLNRRFHLLQQDFGLATDTQKGLMTSWRSIFSGSVTVTMEYRLCTFFWITGMAGMAGILLWQRWQRGKRLQDGTLLYDRVYQSSRIKTPLYRGVFRPRIYLPETMGAKETGRLMQWRAYGGCRRYDWFCRGICAVMLVQWFNPFLWMCCYFAMLDGSMAADEGYLQWQKRQNSKKKSSQEPGLTRQEYAQEIINYNKGEGRAAFSPFVRQEGFLRQRAERLLYREDSKGALPGKDGAGLAVVAACVLFWFGASFLYVKWNGGVWSQTQEAQEEKALFDDDAVHELENEIIARKGSRTPAGIPVTIQLVMEKGTYQREEGYYGKCHLKLLDQGGNVLDELALSRIFTEKQTFPEGTELSLEDYNGDGIQELSIGQRMSVPMGELVPSKSAITARRQVAGFYLINIGDEGMEVISEPIYISDAASLQIGSMPIAFIEGAGGVLSVHLEGEVVYYVWDGEKEKYQREELSEEELAARTASGAAVQGQKQQFALSNQEGKDMLQVNGEANARGEWEIQNVILDPEGYMRKYTDISGIYQGLSWANGPEGPQERYGVLVYDGKRSRTFIIFDVKKREIYYRQEDGCKWLAKMFRQLHRKYGEEEITFQEGGMAMYNLLEIHEDILNIGFAANADHGITIRGSFDYSMKDKKRRNLSYAQVNTSKED